VASKFVVIIGTRGYWLHDSTGIGLPTVEQLALHGAKVYVAARSEKRATEAIRSLRAKHPSLSKEALAWLPLDLSSAAGATKAAQELASKEQRLDIVGERTWNKPLIDL